MCDPFFMSRIYLLFFLTYFMQACQPAEGDIAIVRVNIRHAIHRTVVIESLPGSDEKTRILDSATLRSNNETITFRIRIEEEKPCRLYVRDSDLSINFILHSGDTEIDGDIILPSERSILRSPVNTPLFAFLTDQRQFMEQNAVLVEKARSAAKPEDRQQWLSRYDSVLTVVQTRYRKYADTISSPGGFLFVYSYVDYGREYDSLKAFILRTASRFPRSPSVTRLRERTLDFLKTFEIELEVGDRIPMIALPDVVGNRLPVIMPGRHMLVSFWTTWCNPCLAFLEEEKRLEPWLKAGKLQVVNIALEGDQENWRLQTMSRKLPGVNLIDTGVWEGAVIRQWRIDSIPFNWLVDTQGRILRKAIPGDSLYAVVKTLMTGKPE